MARPIALFQVPVDHLGDAFIQRNFWLPAKHLARFGNFRPIRLHIRRVARNEFNTRFFTKPLLDLTAAAR